MKKKVFFVWKRKCLVRFCRGGFLVGVGKSKKKSDFFKNGSLLYIEILKYINLKNIDTLKITLVNPCPLKYKKSMSTYNSEHLPGIKKN